MKNLFRLVRYARPYWGLLIISGLSLLALTGLNLLAPWLIKDLVSILSDSLEPSDMKGILTISFILFLTFVAKILFQIGRAHV